MFRHPNVIAALILSVGMLLSAALICGSVRSLDATLQTKPMTAMPMTFPDHLTVSNGNSLFQIGVQSYDGKSVVVEQKSR